MKTKLIFLISIHAILCNLSLAQESHGGMPLTYFEKYNTLFTGNSSSKIANVSNYNLPEVDNKVESERADDIKKNCSTCKQKSYYGKGIDVDIDIKSNSTMKLLEDGSKVWLYKINSSNAYALQFYFDKFKLPEGAKLFFYNEDKSMFLGSFTKENNHRDENKKIPFGTQYIAGKTIYIEYYEPAAIEFDAKLHITKILHVFKDVFNKYGGPYDGQAGTCNINVSCPLGIGWTDEISSVALILAYDSNNDLGAWCSGSLLNNTSQDGDPLFLTANHCIDDNTASGDPEYNSDTWTFLFNHQDPNCNGDGSTVSSSLTQSVYGSLVLSSDATDSPTSDWCLLRLLTTVQTLTSYDVCYAGWDRLEVNGSSSPSTVGIHHPRGDVKKISKDYNPPCSSDYGAVCNTGNSHWQVQWNDNAADNNGVTEGGSSGSPLFNSNRKVIGQLHGGFSGCFDSNPPSNPEGTDYYGKLSEDWTNSGAGGLAFYMDPLGTGQTSMNTYCPANINTCNNGIWDIGNGELGVDCGGNCPPCTNPGNGQSNCNNGIQDGGEAGVDCGGTSTCPPCGSVIGGGLGYPKDIAEDDGSCNAHYETFSDPYCQVDVSTFDITDPSTFTRAFLGTPQCIQGEWNALHGRPALVPGYNNIGLYLWGYLNGVTGYGDYWGSDLFFTGEDNFLSNRVYTVSFYAKAYKYNNDIKYGDLLFFLANGLTPNTDNYDWPIYIQWPYTGSTAGYYTSAAGTVNFNLQYIGTYDNAVTEIWHYYKFTFTPPNNNYNQLIFFPIGNQYTEPTTAENPASRIFVDNIAICSECSGQQGDVSYNNVSLPVKTFAHNITAENENVSSGQTVKFIADNEIVLKNNFVASSGSDFVARIKGCAYNSAKENNSNNIVHVNVTDTNKITPQEVFSYSNHKPKNKSKEYLVDNPSQSYIAEQNNYQNSNKPTLQNSKNESTVIINPNPTTGLFQFVINPSKLGQLAKDNTSSTFNISVRNVFGEVVYNSVNQTISSSVKIDLSSHPKGIYFIKIQTADKIYTEKVILQ